MTWTLKVMQGAQLADGLVPELVLPEPLQRLCIGRDPQSHWLFADRTKAISGRHCEIVASPAGPVLRDLSTNGTFVNGAITRMASEHVLRDGDRIEMGPYVVIVSGPPMPPRPREVPPIVAPPPARLPGVTDTAPIRGGDPAAMLAAGGGHEAVRLTEILRMVRPPEDSGVELTKIRLATPGVPRTAPPPPTPRPVTPPAPAPEPDIVLPTLTRPPASLAQALARGLDVPESALQGQELFMLAEQLAAAAAAASLVLRGPQAPPLLSLALRPGDAARALAQAAEALKNGR
jgi:predicted component of type VI protein secretion system